ncbi:MAG: YeeE/YedE thiosulfate transporter family protein [Gemmatimonadota bacterium]
MLERLSSPWPWYVAGPLIGLIVPLLLLLGGKVFGVSSNLRHLCAAIPAPERWKPPYLRYDWLRTGGWNLVFVLGMGLGGVLAPTLFGAPDVGGHISEATRTDLAALGLGEPSGMVPAELFTWGALFTPAGFFLIVVGGFLVGFGARYAGGCTSGHAISGLATFQRSSLAAVFGFFIGGLVATFAVLPWILG